MSRIILRLLVALLVIGPLTRLVAQESKRYFFAGSIYYYNAEGTELRCPYTSVVRPSGQVYFSQIGNEGMHKRGINALL